MRKWISTCSAAFHYKRGLTLREFKRYDDALVNYDKAIALKPDYAEAYNRRSVVLLELKRYDDALASCDKAIALKPDYEKAYNNRGVILLNKGDMQAAEAMFLKAIALKPKFQNPWFNLTNLRKYDDANHTDIGNIQALLDESDKRRCDREYLCFALGKIYDDCGRFEDAFASYRQGNHIRNSRVSYRPNKTSKFTDSLINLFSKDFMAARRSFSSASRSPVFILGMPRSGTTLMANILSNHPAIATAGELAAMGDFATQLPVRTGKKIRYPQAVKHISPTVAARLIEDYEKRLRRDAGANVTYVIDKHPLNFWHLGFITMLFPQARIIHCTRHPLDTGLSNYFQCFPLDYSYAFNLQNIGHFYGEYARLMAHWRAVLPHKMLEISYEDMVVHTESTARKALDFLGLEWDDRCLAPHTNPCAVETASNWQVRQPIYKQSVGRWKNYEKYITPLKEMLQL